MTASQRRLHSNGYYNLLIKYLIVAGDFVVLCLMMHLSVAWAQGSEMLDIGWRSMFYLTGMLSMLVAEYLFATVIHERVVGANQILRRCTMLALTQTVLSYLILRTLDFDARIGWQLLTQGVLLLAVLVVVRFVERWMVKRWRRRGHNRRTITIVGRGREAEAIYRKLVDNPTQGYWLASFYGEQAGLEATGSVDDFAARVIGGGDLMLGDELYLCVSMQERELIERAERLCDERMVKFYYVPLRAERLNLQPVFIDDVEVMTTYTSPLEDPLNRLLKRVVDVVLSVVFLLFTAMLLPVVALIIKMQSRGPVLFRQLRTGLDGRAFYCYKFRSMHVNAEADVRQATDDDPRTFGFGRFMRRTSIDELPQFWNVLRGDMSIVGPRPHMLAHTEQYRQIVDRYMVRHRVKPGVTGWAQVTGYRGETSELWQMEGRVARDIWYIQHWSMWLDLRIVWMTVKEMF